jgi:hypothetical protein
VEGHPAWLCARLPVLILAWVPGTLVPIGTGEVGCYHGFSVIAGLLADLFMWTGWSGLVALGINL